MAEYPSSPGVSPIAVLCTDVKDAADFSECLKCVHNRCNYTVIASSVMYMEACRSELFLMAGEICYQGNDTP